MPYSTKLLFIFILTRTSNCLSPFTSCNVKKLFINCSLSHIHSLRCHNYDDDGGDDGNSYLGSNFRSQAFLDGEYTVCGQMWLLRTSADFWGFDKHFGTLDFWAILGWWRSSPWFSFSREGRMGSQTAEARLRTPCYFSPNALLVPFYHVCLKTWK